jgi:hypothetical protein
MRRNPVIPLWAASACFLLLLCAPSVKAQCGVNSIGFGNVGIVAGNPFHAEVVFTRSGKFPEQGSIFAQHGPQLVARDSQGRVRIDSASGEFKHDNGSEEGTEAEQHLIMICDPVAQTLTQIDTLNATAKILHSRPSAPSFPPPGLSTEFHPSRPARTFCASRMIVPHDGRIRVEDLGYRNIEGVEAHGERIIMLPFAGPASGGPAQGENSTDRWCSDDLAAVVLTVSGNSKRGVQTSSAMQKIERSEPDPSLFQIPPGYAITESVAEPHEGHNRNAAAPPPSNQP